MEPEAVKREGDQKYVWREPVELKRSVEGVHDIPVSPFFSKSPGSETPMLLSPSTGVQLSPIFSQVDLESLLSVISPLSSIHSADFLDIIAATSQASGCRIVDPAHTDPGRETMEVDEWGAMRK